VTAVTELHLERLSTRCTCEKLVAKTDTKDGCAGLIHGSLDVLDGSLHLCGITGTVRDEQTIVVLASELREVVVPRDLQDFDTSSQETSQLIVLKTDINGHYTHRAAGRVLQGRGGVGSIKPGLLNRDCAGVRDIQPSGHHM
jgi:RNase P/RNase MRP subunit p29